MALITLTEAKLLLQITDTSKDALITALIPIIESDVREYCNQDFQDAPTEPSWEAWMKLPAAKMIGFSMDLDAGKGMKSESQGGYSYTREDSLGGYPMGIMHSWDKAKIMATGKMSVKSNYRDMREWNASELVRFEPTPGVQDGEIKE